MDLLSIKLLFPDIRRDDIRIIFAAWLAFACAMDDHLETLPTQVGVESLQDAVGYSNPGVLRLSVNFSIQSVTKLQQRHQLVSMEKTT